MEMLKASENRFEKIALAKLGDDLQLLVERIKILSTCIPKGILLHRRSGETLKMTGS